MGALVSLLVLLSATAWGWSSGGRRRGSCLVPAIVVVLAAAQWLLVDPVHAPVLASFGPNHGLTLGDQLVLPAGAALVRLVRPVRV